jgi:hypothetical protein
MTKEESPSLEPTDKKSTEPANHDGDGERLADGLIVGFTDMMFVALPLLVLTIVNLNRSASALALFASPEWSFAASVLFGQTTVKVISAASIGTIAERSALLGSLVIVFGLVPSLLVLSFVLNAATPTTGLVITQIALFVVASISYLIFATIAHAVRGMERVGPITSDGTRA